MTRKRDRFFALFGALLFLVTASFFTIVVIIQAVGNHNKPKDNTSQTQQQDKTATCPETSVSAPAEAAPAAYKPTSTVTTTQTTELSAGTGATVKSGDCLQVKYYGTLAKDGTMFDENYDKDTGFQFVLGQQQVITGWDKGLVGTKVGGTYRLVIPAAQAYGSAGQGSIPPNADLVFVVKVLSAK